VNGPRILPLALLGFACSRADVVLYCAADQEHAQPIVRTFEERTGLSVRAVFDVEAAKTVGLVRTLLEEKDHPRCDVFWNNEIAHMIRLRAEGILAPYASSSAAGIPAEFRHPEGYWTGFAARGRVLVVHDPSVPEAERPRSLRDLADPRWKGKTAIARPITGTTLTHFAALFEAWGEERARAFCEALLGNEVNLTSGNAVVARKVGDGVFAFGLTDTDDVESQRRNGKPVSAVFPDGEGAGTLLIPNTVALIRGGPNPENGRRLVDFLLSPEVEMRLAFSASANIPVRVDVETPPGVRRLGSFRRMFVDWYAVAGRLDARLEEMNRIFVR